MDVFVSTSSYNWYGASWIFRLAGDLLTLELGEYGAAVDSIEIVAHLRSPTRNPRRTLESLFDRFHESLRKLPKITFRRRLKRLEISFLSEHFHADDNEGCPPSVEWSHIAAMEVAEVLPLVKKRIKPEDDFDTARFLKDSLEVLSRNVRSLQEREQIRTKAQQRRQALHAAMSSWERLGIDWSHYHPKAREILDDPFYWESSSDLSPNGNDTGADLLDDFRKWDKQNRKVSPRTFLGRLFQRWDIEPVDWLLTNEADVLQLSQDQPISLSVCNEAAIAVAFAALKVRADCPADIVEMAECALRRTEILVKASTHTAEVKTAWKVAIGKMRVKLESLTR